MSFEVGVGVDRLDWGGGAGEKEQRAPSPNSIKGNAVPRNGEGRREAG